MFKFNKKRANIIGATFMAIFSLGSVFAGTYAWFAMNTTVTGSGARVKITRITGRLQNVYFHAFDHENSTENSFKFNKTPFATYEYDWDDEQINLIDDEYAAWELGDYSYMDKNHCMLVIFAFDKDYRSVNQGDMFCRGVTTVGGDNLVTRYSDGGEPLETSGGGFLGARTAGGSPYYTLPQTQVNDSTHTDSILMRREIMTDNQGNPVTDNQGNPKYYDYYALSSVASFSYRDFDDSSYTSFLSQNAGSLLSFDTSTLHDGGAFTTIKNDTDKYIFDQSPFLYESASNTSIKYIALVVNYSPEAIGYIYSTYLGDSGLNGYDSVLRFACDWRFEVA